MPDLKSSEVRIDELDYPAMIIDISRAEILSINNDARRIWGLGSDAALPIALDPAMPALTRLGSSITSQTVNGKWDWLVFWTATGAQNLRCAVRLAEGPRTVLVSFESPSAASVSDVVAAVEPGPQVAIRKPVDRGFPDDPATMAHELRTPMAAIIALAEMIEREQFGPVGDPRYREYARDIGDSARLSLGIVAAALEQKGTAEGILLGGFSEIDVRELVDKCCRTMQQVANQADVSLIRELSDDLPNLIANAPALTQIMLNLLSNAIKFTPERGAVTLRAAIDENGSLVLGVSDTGVGMTGIDTRILVDSDAGINAVADSCSGDDTEPASDATVPRQTRGIGFSLVRRLATAMGARLEIDSTRGVGTRVNILFPQEKIVHVVAQGQGR